MANSKTAIFPVVHRGKRGTVLFAGDRVLVSIDGMEVAFRNEKPAKGRRPLAACHTQARRLAELASDAILRYRAAAEARELEKIKDYAA